MSRENVEVIERIYAAATTPVAFEVYHPDIEWDMTEYEGWTDQPIYHGHEGVRTFMRGWITSFDRWEATIERALAVDDEVLAVVADVAYLRGSGVPMTRRYAHAFTFRDGLVVRSRLYSDPAKAFEAMGLRE